MAQAAAAMEFSGNGLLVLFHVLFASLWFGGVAYQVRIIGGTLMQAGPAASGFLTVLARRKGVGWYFALTGLLTILFGGALYGQEMHSGAIADAWSGRGLWLTLGAILAVLAYLHGMTANFPIERRWLKLSNSITGQPTPEQAKQLQDYGMKLGKNGAISAMIVGLAMLCMLLSRVFPS